MSVNMDDGITGIPEEHDGNSRGFLQHGWMGPVTDQNKGGNIWNR